MPEWSHVQRNGKEGAQEGAEEAGQDGGRRRRRRRLRAALSSEQVHGHESLNSIVLLPVTFSLSLPAPALPSPTALSQLLVTKRPNDFRMRSAGKTRRNTTTCTRELQIQQLSLRSRLAKQTAAQLACEILDRSRVNGKRKESRRMTVGSNGQGRKAGDRDRDLFRCSPQNEAAPMVVDGQAARLHCCSSSACSDDDVTCNE